MWSQRWFDAIAGRRFANKESHKKIWRAARAYYQLTGNLRLFKDISLRFWSLAYGLWRRWTKA